MESPIADGVVAEPQAGPSRSRRALLAAALGGLVGSVATALGRPTAAAAATGDSLVVGHDNFAGPDGTHLFATSSGGAFWATQYGFGSGVRADSVSGHGGVFTTQHVDRFGITASNTGALGNGAAISALATSNHGILAATASANRYAIKATQASASAYAVAVYGEISSSSTGTMTAAVRGVNNNTSAQTGVGVYGSTGGSGYGVLGYSVNGPGVLGSSSTSVGVQGLGSSEFGSGMQGSSTGLSGHGVTGYVTAASGTASGIYGIGTSPGYAGYFDGAVAVTGAFSAPSSALRLDHPLDPANKTLSHAAVQSPELKTIYDGVVTTDTAGMAWVELPAWFGALNGDIRYQLTVVGTRAEAWVSQRLVNARFGIATSIGSVEVSWQLTGVRRDAWATAHPLIVETAKAGQETGRYLHPQEHGRPASLGIAADARQRAAAAADRAEEPPTP